MPSGPGACPFSEQMPTKAVGQRREDGSRTGRSGGSSGKPTGLPGQTAQTKRPHCTWVSAAWRASRAGGKEGGHSTGAEGVPRSRSQGGARPRLWSAVAPLTCLDFSSWRCRTSLLSTRVRARFSRSVASLSWLWSMACSVGKSCYRPGGSASAVTSGWASSMPGGQLSQNQDWETQCLTLKSGRPQCTGRSFQWGRGRDNDGARSLGGARCGAHAHRGAFGLHPKVKCHCMAFKRWMLCFGSVLKRPRYHSERSQPKGAVASEATTGAGVTQRQAKNQKSRNDAGRADRGGGDPVRSSSPSLGPRVAGTAVRTRRHREGQGALPGLRLRSRGHGQGGGTVQALARTSWPSAWPPTQV